MMVPGSLQNYGRDYRTADLGDIEKYSGLCTKHTITEKVLKLMYKGPCSFFLCSFAVVFVKILNAFQYIPEH